MLLLPSSLPCVCVVWGCIVYCCSAKSCAVLVSGMLCPPSSQVMQPPPPPCALVPGLLVGWLLVFGLFGWLLGSLVGCWQMGFGQLSLAGWLVGWFVAWFVVCCLFAGVCAEVM